LQLPEDQARLQGDFVGDQLDEFSNEEYSDVPTERQDPGVLVDDADLGVHDDQLHEAMAGSEDNDISEFGLHMDHKY